MEGEIGPRPSRRQRILQVLEGAPGWPTTCFALAVVATHMWADSFPGGRLHTLAATIGIWVALLVWAGVRYLLALGVRQHRSRRWLVLPILGILTALASWSHAPLHFRFALSRGAFERALADLEAGRFPGTRIGLYQAGSIRTSGSGGWVEFLVPEAGPVDEAGFRYNPAGLDLDPDDYQTWMRTYRHLSGPWYAWHRRAHDDISPPGGVCAPMPRCLRR